MIVVENKQTRLIVLLLFIYYNKMYWLERRCHSVTVAGALNNKKVVSAVLKDNHRKWKFGVGSQRIAQCMSMLKTDASLKLNARKGVFFGRSYHYFTHKWRVPIGCDLWNSTRPTADL